jgi:hypothetical protein
VLHASIIIGVDIPPSWAIALAVGGLTAGLAIIGLRSNAASRAARVIPPITHLLAGGLIGFMALAFYPALPLLAAIGGMLAVRASQSSRWTDAALLAVGFGAALSVLFGSAIVNDALDPAVYGPDLTGWFVASATVLVASLLALIALVAWPEGFSPRR